MPTFIENCLHFMKNCIRPHYEKLKPLKSGFIENSIFENNRDPWLSGASATASPRLATYRRGSCLLVFETVILRPELRRPPAEMHRRDHYVLSRHLPASSALFAASLRQVAAISPALPLANRAAAAATVVVNQQATGSQQKKKAKRDGKRTTYV